MNAFTELEQALDPAEPIFTTEGARRLLNMPPNPEKADRMQQLGEKANEGLLSPSERSEYEALIHAGKLMSIMRLKAQAFLLHFKAA